MAKPLKIDFISDISCGWCAVGLHAIEEAIRNVAPDIEAEFNFQPFELNPKMPVGGENLTDHLQLKYGKFAAMQYLNATTELGAAVGFEFSFNENSRIYNTFDAHRLLHWAGLKGRQTELSHALFEAHFTRNEDPGSHAVLLGCVEALQMDVSEARNLLESDTFAETVRLFELNSQRMGINAVPTIIINDTHVVSGSRSVELFEQAILAAMDTTSSPAGTYSMPFLGEGDDK